MIQSTIKEFEIQPSRVLFWRNKAWGIFFTIIIIVLFLCLMILFPSLVLSIIHFFVYPRSFYDYYLFFITLAFILLLVWLIYGLYLYMFVKSRKLLISENGVSVNGKLIARWDELRGYYIKNSYLILVTKFKQSHPFFVISWLAGLKFVPYEIAFKFDDTCDVAEALKEFIPQINNGSIKP